MRRERRRGGRLLMQMSTSTMMEGQKMGREWRAESMGMRKRIRKSQAPQYV